MIKSDYSIVKNINNLIWISMDSINRDIKSFESFENIGRKEEFNHFNTILKLKSGTIVQR